MGSNSPRVLLLGATGLVGSHCFRLLLNHEMRPQIRVLARRSPLQAISDPHVWVVDPLVELSSLGPLFDCDAVICALGTTRKQAKTRQNFLHADLRLPLSCAAMAKTKGAKTFCLVSAMGSNANSPWFYNRTKGELEDALQLLGFPSLSILRPSLLLGERKVLGQNPRRLEGLVQQLSLPVLSIIPAFWRPVDAEKVATALVNCALNPAQGVRVIYNRTLVNI